MPLEPVISWIALGVIGLGAAWIFIEAIGLHPRAIRVRRAIRRSGAGSLLCGNCGHPAVSLGEIEACPECGSRYASVGLDGRASASRWSPPMVLVVLLLLGTWALGSMWLAPIAARWVNEQTIGAPAVERVRSTRLFGPTAFASGSGRIPDFAFELDVLTDRPSNWRIGPGRDHPVLAGGKRQLRLAIGGGASALAQSWMHIAPVMAERFPPDAGDPSLIAAMRPSSAGGLPPDMDIFTLEWDPAKRSWTLGSRRLGALDDGIGLDTGIDALLTHARSSPGLSSGPVMSDAHARTMAELAQLTDSARVEPPRRDALPDFVGLSAHGEAEAVVWSTPYTRAAPWGLVAAVGSSASLLLIALVLWLLSWRTSRRCRPGGQTTATQAP